MMLAWTNFIERTAKLSVIWNAMALIELHDNGMTKRIVYKYMILWFYLFIHLLFMSIRINDIYYRLSIVKKAYYVL